MILEVPFRVSLKTHRAVSGGIITREGQYLVIRYIPDPYTGINHILYIAEPEAP